MDVYTRNNLELIKTIRNDDRYGSLLWVLDKTKTAMGARLLKSYLYRPLADAKEIEERLDIVEALSKDFLVRKELSGLLAEIYDLPRLIGRIGYGNANGKDLVQLSRSLKVIPNIKSLLNKSATACLVNLSQKLEKLDAVVSLINKSIVDNPPFVIREGGMIRRGYDKELDQLYILSKGANNGFPI